MGAQFTNLTVEVPAYVGSELDGWAQSTMELSAESLLGLVAEELVVNGELRELIARIVNSEAV